MKASDVRVFSTGDAIEFRTENLGMFYDLSVKEIGSVKHSNRWVDHLSRKRWFDKRVRKDFISAVSDLFTEAL